MVLSIPATVTVSSGATYHFPNLYPRSRVTKLLAQFVRLCLRGRPLDTTSITDNLSRSGKREIPFFFMGFERLAVK
jgi:hypothetical protein